MQKTVKKMSSPDGVQTWNKNVSFAWTNITYYLLFVIAGYDVCSDVFPVYYGNGPGPTGNGPGRAGPDLPGMATGRAGPELNGPGRAEKNGPVQASNVYLQTEHKQLEKCNKQNVH